MPRMTKCLAVIVAAALACASCSDDSGSAPIESSTTTSRPPVAPFVVDANRHLDDASLVRLKDRLLLREDAELVLARAPHEGDARPTQLAVVMRSADGDRFGLIVDDSDGDGRFAESDSGGLDPPTFKSASGTAVAGVALFSSMRFVFAYSSVPGSVVVEFSTGSVKREVATTDGVADLTDAWGELASEGERFTITWRDSGGAVIDILAEVFPGRVT